MAIVITGENVLIEGEKYDVLCHRAALAKRLEKVAMCLGEVLSYTEWEQDADDDAKEAFQRLRAAYEAL